MDADLSPDDLHRLLEAVGARLAELTDLPLERAVELAGSVVGCVVLPDEAGMLTFRDAGGTPAVCLPFSAFEALLGDEDEKENGAEDPER